MTHEKLAFARRGVRALAAAAAETCISGMAAKSKRGRGVPADTLPALDTLAEQLAAPILAAIDAAERDIERR